MRTTRRKNSKMRGALPTIAVGGELPTSEEEQLIKTDIEKKIEVRKAEVPQKPEDNSVPINKPMAIKTDAFSIEKEYIDLAKKYVGIHPDRTPSLAEFAKAFIKKIEEQNKIIESLKKPRNDGMGRIMWSNEEYGMWN